MPKVRFISPYQSVVEASEFGITFERGEVLEIADDAAKALLQSPHFELVDDRPIESVFLPVLAPVVPEAASPEPEPVSAPAPLVLISEES
jgi:hypothetical protein